MSKFKAGDKVRSKLYCDPIEGIVVDIKKFTHKNIYEGLTIYNILAKTGYQTYYYYEHNLELINKQQMEFDMKCKFKIGDKVIFEGCAGTIIGNITKIKKHKACNTCFVLSDGVQNKTFEFYESSLELIDGE